MKKFFGVSTFSIFLGVILGLSKAPTISILVTALTGIIAFLIGIKTKSEVHKYPIKIDFSSLGVFSVSGLIGIFLGLFLKTNVPWAESPSQLKESWMLANVGEKQAIELMIYQKTGLIPKGMLIDKNQAEYSRTPLVLFSNSDSLNSRLNPEEYSELEHVEFAWKNEEGIWKEYNKKIDEKIPENLKKNAYQIIWLLHSK